MFLVIIQTLRSGARAGVLTSLAPLLSDLLVITVSLLVLSRLPDWTLGALGLAGGAYIAYLAWETWTSATAGMPSADSAAMGWGTVLGKATTVNLLSPHPWLTWATVMGPLVISTIQASVAGGVGLVAGFYLTLIGSKAVIAVLVGRGRHLLGGRGYAWVMRIAAVLLLGAGLVLVVESLHGLGVW